MLKGIIKDRKTGEPINWVDSIAVEKDQLAQSAILMGIFGNKFFQKNKKIVVSILDMNRSA